MNDRDILREERAERVQTFGTDNNNDWPADSLAAGSYAKIGQYLKDLGKAKVGQVRVAVSKQTLLDALWLDFRNIARTSRAIALDEPGFGGPYKLPEDKTENLITTHADALLKLLEENDAPEAEGGDTAEQKAAKTALRKKFTDHFLAADFVTTLRTDRDAIDAKNQQKNSGNQVGIESTEDIEVILETIATEVLRLDAMMQNLYARDAGKLQAWHKASRVWRTAQKKKDAGGSGNATDPSKKGS